MSEINLLPLDLSPKRQSYKLASSIKKLSVILLGGFLIVGTLAVVYLVYLKVQTNTSLNNQKALSQSIRNLEGTEQKLFLTKDRLAKIKTVLGNVDKYDVFSSVDSVLSALPGGLVPYSVQIDSTKTQFSVLGQSSVQMASFLNSLALSGKYKNLDLTGFVFTPDRGYLITLGIN